MSSPSPVSLASPIPACLQEITEENLQGFLQAAERRGLSVPQDAGFRERLQGLFAASVFAARFCQRYPEILLEAEALARLDSSVSLEDYRAQVSAVLAAENSEPALMSALRVLRQQEMIRIAWRDLHALATPAETLRNLSELAEAFIDGTLHYCYNELATRFGVPRSRDGVEQKLVALGMGKLGGLELNYSSDIDLILTYPESGATDGRKPLDISDFYRRVVQRFAKLLNEPTADGFVFRVDLRLRPFGNSGPVAMSFDAMEAYYQTQGREWERYAMIKARAVSGEADTVAQLFAFLRPFVFRRYLDYSAFESLRELKAKIALQVQRKGMEGNVKLGAGGIREIEFIGQAFQLVRGGKETELQVRGIVPVLNLLGRKGYLPQDEVEDLLAAYDFLRATENRLQMVQDAQTHVLPEQPEERARLAYTMGFAEYDAFLVELNRHRVRVQSIFESVFQIEGGAVEELPEASLFKMIWAGDMTEDEAVSEIEAAGFSHPGLLYEQLVQLGQGGFYSRLTNTARERLDTLMPPVLKAASETFNPDDTAARLLGLLRNIAGRSVYLQVLIDNPPSLALLVRLFSASRWLADFVTSSPMVIDEVLDHRLLEQVPGQAEMEAEMATIIARVENEGLDVQMDAIRQFRQAAVMRVIVADIEGYMPLKDVSNYLTAIAEVVLQGAAALVQSAMRVRHGIPHYELDGERHEAKFAIVGYGKLGGYELGYGSDLDVVFLHDSAGTRQESDGDKPLENTVYFARMAQMVMSFLQTTTPAGTLYEVDTRLRPNGNSGLLVSSLTAFADYQENKAWTWEHQALVRARMVVGSEGLQAGFRGVRHAVLSRSRERETLRTDVTEMRERMRRELSKAKAGEFDLKQDRGGIVDIEFMVQYSVLAHACDHPALTDWTDNLRIIERLRDAGFLSADQAARIMEVYFTYRGHTHTQALQGVKTPVPMTEEITRCCDDILALWTHLVENDGAA